MGADGACVARHGDWVGPGRAQLEADALRFRGDFRFVVPLAAITRLAVVGDWLEIDAGPERYALELKQRAQRWHDAIRTPKSRLDKLGVTATQRILWMGELDLDFDAEMRERAIAMDRTDSSPSYDVIFLVLTMAVDLERLAELRSRLRPDGALWTVRPKGTPLPGLSEREVMAAGKAAGFVDVKVVTFSADRTAEKYVIPRAAR